MTGAYWDTSLLLKLYAVELGSPAVVEAASKENRLVVSALAQAEIPSAFHRKLREGEWSSRQIEEGLAQVDYDVANGFLVFAALTPGIWRRVRSAYEEAPSNFFLRAPDAIHLGDSSGNGIHGHLLQRPSSSRRSFEL